MAAMNHAESVAPSLELALTYGTHSCLMSMLGWQGRGARYGDRATALGRAFDDLLVIGQSSLLYGIGLYASARYEESMARLDEGIDAFVKAGGLWEENLAHFHRACCHFGLGDLPGAIAEAKQAFASSARIGDSRVLCSAYVWARAAGGDIPFEELKGCFPDRPDDVMSTVHGIMAEGHWHTFQGRTAEAVECFERAWSLVRASLCVNSHTILALPELAAALRRRADAIRDADPKQVGRLLRHTGGWPDGRRGSHDCSRRRIRWPCGSWP